MMRVLPSKSQACLATNQFVAGCETLLQTVESSSTFWNKLRACCGPRQTCPVCMVCDSRVILSNQKTVLRNLHQPDLLQDRFEPGW